MIKFRYLIDLNLSKTWIKYKIILNINKNSSQWINITIHKRKKSHLQDFQMNQFLWMKKNKKILLSDLQSIHRLMFKLLIINGGQVKVQRRLKEIRNFQGLRLNAKYNFKRWCQIVHLKKPWIILAAYIPDRDLCPKRWMWKKYLKLAIGRVRLLSKHLLTMPTWGLDCWMVIVWWV